MDRALDSPFLLWNTVVRIDGFFMKTVFKVIAIEIAAGGVGWLALFLLSPLWWTPTLVPGVSQALGVRVGDKSVVEVISVLSDARHDHQLYWAGKGIVVGMVVSATGLCLARKR